MNQGMQIKTSICFEDRETKKKQDSSRNNMRLGKCVCVCVCVHAHAHIVCLLNVYVLQRKKHFLNVDGEWAKRKEG